MILRRQWVKKMKLIESKIKYVLVLLAFLFMGIGILREEHFIVLEKAVKICLECIGVG